MATTVESRWTLAFFFILAVTVPADSASAETPAQTLQEHIDRALVILNDPVVAQKSHRPRQFIQLKSILQDAFAFDEFSHRALGLHAQNLTAEEKQAFTAAFTDFLTAFYISELQNRYAGETVQLLDQQRVNDRQAMVRTLVDLIDFKVPVDVMMIRNGERWQAYDLLIFGISVAGWYRFQIGELLDAEDISSLNRLLKNKAAKRKHLG